MAHYLYVLQSVSLNLYDRRMRTSMDPYSQVGERSPCLSNPASSCGSRAGRGFAFGVRSFPSAFAFVLGFKPRGTCLRGSRWHPSPLLVPPRSSGSSSSRCAKLPSSRRARRPPATSAPSAGGPCAPRSSASWASRCGRPLSPPRPHASSTSRLQQDLQLLPWACCPSWSCRVVLPFCHPYAAKQQVLWSCRAPPGLLSPLFAFPAAPVWKGKPLDCIGVTLLLSSPSSKVESFCVFPEQQQPSRGPPPCPTGAPRPRQHALFLQAHPQCLQPGACSLPVNSPAGRCWWISGFFSFLHSDLSLAGIPLLGWYPTVAPF